MFLFLFFFGCCGLKKLLFYVLSCLASPRIASLSHLCHRNFASACGRKRNRRTRKEGEESEVELSQNPPSLSEKKGERMGARAGRR
jgi:hypothetical protein